MLQIEFYLQHFDLHSGNVYLKKITKV